jgi:N-carbamoylputrescine amidase
MRNIVVAATQMSCSWEIDENIAKAERMVREAAGSGGQVILLQELFETPYFCQEKLPQYYQYALPAAENKAVRYFRRIARELRVVLPISFYERDGASRYNSLAMIDADGSVLGIYRKTHLPCGPGYEERFYFEPGDSGFKVWQTRFGKIGVGICWDQWFTEAARCMALQGAELLMYPTAIGSEPDRPEVDSKTHWQMVMRGHAAANIMPVVASNRIGGETVGGSTVTFYGSSFIANETGVKVAEAGRNEETVLLAEFDLDQLAQYRDYWGIFKDRRPEMYRLISEADSANKPLERS